MNNITMQWIMNKNGMGSISVEKKNINDLDTLTRCFLCQYTSAENIKPRCWEELFSKILYSREKNIDTSKYELPISSWELLNVQRDNPSTQLQWKVWLLSQFKNNKKDIIKELKKLPDDLIDLFKEDRLSQNLFAFLYPNEFLDLGVAKHKLNYSIEATLFALSKYEQSNLTFPKILKNIENKKLLIDSLNSLFAYNSTLINNSSLFSLKDNESVIDKIPFILSKLSRPEISRLSPVKVEKLVDALLKSNLLKEVDDINVFAKDVFSIRKLNNSYSVRIFEFLRDDHPTKEKMNMLNSLDLDINTFIKHMFKEEHTYIINEDLDYQISS